MTISLATSTINKTVRKNVKECLDTGRIGGGRFVKEFEDKVAEYMGAKHAIATCNGSMADIVALATLKVLNPSKTEVIVPALTFIAQTNAVLINGLTPIFVDIKEDYQIDDTKVSITDNTLAVFPANLLGKIAPIVPGEFDVPMVEDSCEAFGIRRGEAMTIFSFFPSHTITTGEGGMIITDSDTHAEIARKMINHGRRSDKILEKFHYDFMGFNGKTSNVAAAIGLGVMEEVDEIIETRKKNVFLYNNFLENDFYAESPHAYPYIYKNQLVRDARLLTLEMEGIEARKIFSCIPTAEYGMKGNFPVAEKIASHGLFVPIHQDLTQKEIKKIASIIRY